MRVGTTPLDLNALTTAAEDCAEMPCGEHGVARSSTGVGAARAAEALRRRERIVENCMMFVQGFHVKLGSDYVPCPPGCT